MGLSVEGARIQQLWEVPNWNRCGLEFDFNPKRPIDLVATVASPMLAISIVDNHTVYE